MAISVEKFEKIVNAKNEQIEKDELITNLRATVNALIDELKMQYFMKTNGTSETEYAACGEKNKVIIAARAALKK